MNWPNERINSRKKKIDWTIANGDKEEEELFKIDKRTKERETKKKGTVWSRRKIRQKKNGEKPKLLEKNVINKKVNDRFRKVIGQWLKVQSENAHNAWNEQIYFQYIQYFFVFFYSFILSHFISTFFFCVVQKRQQQKTRATLKTTNK